MLRKTATTSQSLEAVWRAMTLWQSPQSRVKAPHHTCPASDSSLRKRIQPEGQTRIGGSSRTRGTADGYFTMPDRGYGILPSHQGLSGPPEGTTCILILSFCNSSVPTVSLLVSNQLPYRCVGTETHHRQWWHTGAWKRVAKRNLVVLFSLDSILFPYYMCKDKGFFGYILYIVYKVTRSVKQHWICS